MRSVLLGACLLACGLGLAPRAAARDVPGDGILSPRLAELSRPAVSPLPAGRQAGVVGLPAVGPGSLQRLGRRLVVEVRFTEGVLARLAGLRAAGAQVIAASRRYQTATVAVKPGGLTALAGIAGAQAAREALAPMVAAACPAGAAVSQGDAQLAAAPARADFGLDGSGVTVGILSDSFGTAGATATSAASDVAAGDLPGEVNPCGYRSPVDVLSDYSPFGPSEPESTDEGRGMAQIVHDLAPGAGIDFATAEGGEAIFAKHIKDLASAGADVIVDDISYFGEPFFQDGPVAVAASEAEAEGVTYLSAAGNDNLFEGNREIASWETPKFRDAAGCPAELETLPAHPDHCLDFNPKAGQEDDTFGITVEPEETLIVDLQWSEPWFGVEADLDAYLLDSAGQPLNLVQGGTSDNISDEEPVEELAWENPGAEPVEVQLAIDRCFSTEPAKQEKKGCNYQASETAKPRVKLILAENGSGVAATEYPHSAEGDIVGPTVYGHSGSPSVIAVGAVPSNNSGAVERYSSRGPVTHYYEPVTGTTPAPPLASPETIQKPDLAATDCVSTSFFVPVEGRPGFTFCGTSAAAPHAAAVVALARQANPAASPAQVRAGLAATARPVGAFGHDDVVGAGLLYAYGAIDEIALPPKISFIEPPTSTSSRQPAIAFAANRPVSFFCSLDGGPATPCSSPFTPAQPLGDGPHTLLVRGLDLSGRTGQAETLFVVDTVPPRTFFAAHPRKHVRTRKARVLLKFRFGSDTQGASFVCRVDGGLFHFCPSVFSRRFGPGKHAVRVKAVDSAGNVDPTVALYRFRVRRVG
jgi:subtilase family protein